MPIGFGDVLVFILSAIGLFCMSFYFLTIFSPRKYKVPKNTSFFPKVSIIIPMWNEGSQHGARLKKTVNSLLHCDYPKEQLEIIIVNDGSTDDSLEIAKGFEQYGVRVFSHKKSRGKTCAVNTGMKYATGEFVAGLDADSFIEADVISKLVMSFKNKKVMAAIPAIKIHKPKTILQKIQAQELLSAVFIRYVQAQLGGIPMAPGAFTMIRKTFIDKYGGLSAKTMVEDLEISMRIQSEHFLIENVINANVYTSGVKTFKQFESQRLRWFYGFIIQLKRYKHLFSKRYGNLGLFIMPSSLAFVILSIFAFSYSMIMLLVNLVDWLLKINLIGFEWSDLFTFKTDLFFLTISNKTLIPVLLLVIMYFFMLYMKRITNEKSNVTVPFITFILTYWALGAWCWLKALYFYIRKKPVKWGPNYFYK